MTRIKEIEKYLTKLLDRHRICLMIALFAFLSLHLPAINSGLSVDDFIFQSEIIEDHNKTDLYNFDKTLKELKPWWTHEEHKFVLFRPLSSFLIATDYHLFGDNYYLWHFHSILWGLGLILGAWYLFNLTLSRKAASLATIILSCSCFISWPVDYIAQRNHLVAITAGVWALFFYIKWRNEGLKSGRLLSLIGVVIGLLGGEYAITTIMYLLSFEAFKSKLKIKKFFYYTWPILFALICYLIILKLVGAGTYGMPGYLHPISEPLAYLKNLPQRLISLLGYLINLPMAYSGFKTTILYYIALIIIVLMGIHSFWRINKQRIGNNNFDISTIYWYTSGTILSLFPIASTIPKMRLISCGAIGFSALTGVLISNYMTSNHQVKWPIYLKLFVVYLLFFSFIYSPKWCLSTTQWLKNNNRACIDAFRDAIDHKAISKGKHTVVVRGPSYHCTLVLPKICIIHDYKPLGYKVLTATQHPISIKIIDTYAIEIESIDGSLLSSFIGRWFRNSDSVNQFKTGDLVINELFSAKIIEIENGFPIKIQFLFKIPLDSTSIQFVIWENDRLVPINLPKTNEKSLFIDTYSRGTLW